jgi:sulfoxide reductase heme-binding subunit YedZ
VVLSEARFATLRWFVAKAAVHAVALWPLALMVRAALGDALGADPVAELTHRTGDWTLRLLLACLAMTPLRRLLDRPWPIRFRRLLGLWAFAYACLHLAVYVVLDLNGYWAQVLVDVVKRPFMMVGFAAWLLLVPLALTSTRAAMRKLGRRWGVLHRAVYLAAALGVLHFWWGVKADVREPMLYAAVLALLLGARVAWRWREARARGPAARLSIQPMRGE